MIKKPLLGVFLAVCFIFIQATFNALNTQSSYVFTDKYPTFGSEMLKVDFNKGRVKMNLVRKNTDNKIISSSLFSGIFLRFQNHYYTFGVKRMNKSRGVDFTFRNFFIDSLRTNEAVYISDDRGILELDNGHAINLSSLLLGNKIR
ncbi:MULTISPECIES: hypothetical protein [Photobacterium]|uniref:hypothetical protein n=1 Tax=Photobacterium TaxID=657 RepID=UPI0006B54C58|nr:MULTISPECIES: hypothetical protein [Photobacterium]MBP2700315.1 hypothetical protein [Vibrio parahaemolyticus]KPA51129.1 hypothetical protein VT25_19965 [Photobacterium leiognathi subsp. mandapamensis]MZG55342.1 hypothetical protein [Photobacterium lucens]MZG82937.1 hypothetical protein [Photobacterium lucens]PSV19341.1 hypothetical protein C0W44_15690 [Photobacterium leiognathi subsp. mandapamensis]